MKRILMRPPKLVLGSTFAEAYSAGRFTQLDLVTQSDVRTEATKHGLGVNDDTLEDLDRASVFSPVAFAGLDHHRPAFGPRWNVDELTFRDEVGFRPWSRYRFREHAMRRVIALYSPWQLMYLKSALEDQIVTFTLPFVLGRRERLLRAMTNHRPFWRVDRDFWKRLEEQWRPTILLLCWIQNRYLPHVRGRTRMIRDEKARGYVDPLREEIRTFEPQGLLDRLGLSSAEVLAVYEQLARIAQTRDPIADWFMVVRAASHRAHDKFEGDARLAQLTYDAAEMLRRFLYDVTAEVQPDCDEAFGWSRGYKERVLGHEPGLVYDRDDFKRILEHKHLSPFGVHVFVEGPSDEDLIGGLIDAFWGDHRALGIRITPMHGIGHSSRRSPPTPGKRSWWPTMKERSSAI